MRHIWTESDELLAIEAYYRKATGEELIAIANRIGVRKQTLRVKLQNIEYLDTNGESGLPKTGQQIIPIWEEYCRTHNIR